MEDKTFEAEYAEPADDAEDTEVMESEAAEDTEDSEEMESEAAEDPEEEDAAECAPRRRKGQPKGKNIEPLEKKVVRCVCLWILTIGLLTFLLMLGFWTSHNVRLVLDAAYALGETATEAIDTDAAKRLAEQVLEIRKDAPAAPTADYKADEQVVVLSRYDVLKSDADYQALKTYLEKISSRYPYTGEYSLVGTNDTQLIYLISPLHPTGYTAALDKISTAGPDQYDISNPESRREGTVVLVPLGTVCEDGTELAICCGYSYGGVLAGEKKNLLIPLIVIVAGLVICSLRLLWIIYRHEDENAAEKEETPEDTEEENEETPEDAEDI